MPLVNLENLGLKGLNTDTPSQTLDPTEFSDGIDLRPFDGSLQGVYDFGDVDENVDGDGDTRDIYGLTQWTRTGEETLNVAYLYGDGTDLSFQVVTGLTATDSDIITGAVAMTPLDDNTRFNIDIFAFNDLIIVNDGQNHPVYIVEEEIEDPDDSSMMITVYSAKLLPNWPNGEVTDVVANERYVILDPSLLTEMQWLGILPDGDMASDIIQGRVFTARAALAGVGLAVGTPVLAERITQYNNRLIAVNISEEYLGDESYGNSTILWSTPITALNDIKSVSWTPMATNDAGDDILTETVGEVLDGASLGQYLIIYKSDGVFRVNDVGGPLVLATELLFDDDGLYSPQCFSDIGDGKHFVLGNYGVYLHDGGPNKENVSRGRVEKELYSSIDQTKRDRTFLFHHNADKEVWVCYADSDHMGSGCNKAFVFNYMTNSWYRRNLIPEGLAEDSAGIRGMTEAELSGELFLYGWGELGPRRLGTERGFVGGGLRTEGNVEFRNMVLNDPVDTKGLTGVYPTGDSSFQVGVTVSNHLAEVMSYTMRDYNPTNMYKLDYRLNGRYYHLKMAQIENNNPKITNVGIDVRTRGKR